MIQVASTNIEFKIKITCILSETFTLIQGFPHGYPLSILLCIIVAKILAILNDADTRIKNMNIEDHENKTVNFDDDTTIFLREFTCRTKIELFLKLCEQPSSSKKKLKSQTLWNVAFKNRIGKPRKRAWSQFSKK